MTPRLSFVTVCRGRLAQIQQSLPSRTIQAGCEAILVDYDCPERAGDWSEAHHPDVRVVRSGPRGGYHGPRARNLGIRAAQAPWVAMVDADLTLAANFAAVVLPTLERGHFYLFSPATSESYGALVAARDDLLAIEGYDEAIEGWGGADSDLYYRLRRLGRRAGMLNASLIQVESHGDDLRFAYYAIRDKALSQQINVSYCHAKYQMEFDLGRVLTADERTELYAKVRAVLLPALQRGDNPAVMTLQLPQMHHLGMPAGVQLQRTLVYEVRKTTGDGIYPYLVL